jgi:hypothetical protein
MPPLRYVILWHDGVDEPHFDLMFETLPGSALATWRSPRWPVEGPTVVTRLKDHRRAYLEYEGELSERRGRVERVATGTCVVEVGEGSVWRVTLLTGTRPQQFALRALDTAAQQSWEIAPAS